MDPPIILVVYTRIDMTSLSQFRTRTLSPKGEANPAPMPHLLMNHPMRETLLGADRSNVYK
jgi:hypothetical protein